MNIPVREGETIEGSRTTRNRPYPVLKCSSESCTVAEPEAGKPEGAPVASRLHAKITTGPQRSWEEDRRKRRGVERLCIPPGAPLRRGGVVGG